MVVCGLLGRFVVGSEKAARGGCRLRPLFFLSFLNASRLQPKLCHDFQMEIAFVYQVFGGLEGCGGLDTLVLGCIC
jgi:hypothetical protein